MSSLTRVPTKSFVSCYARLCAFISRRVPSRHDAEDLAHDACLRTLAWQERTVIENPEGALFRVARNLLVDRSRREAAVPILESYVDESRTMVEQTCPASTAEARDRLAVVQAAIQALPQRCRQIFILNRFGGLSYPEIARKLGLSQSTVEKHMIRALASCKRALEEAEGK